MEFIIDQFACFQHRLDKLPCSIKIDKIPVRVTEPAANSINRPYLETVGTIPAIDRCFWISIMAASKASDIKFRTCQVGRA